MFRQFPNALSAARIAATPVLALLSDIADGLIARVLHPQIITVGAVELGGAWRSVIAITVM